MNITLQQRLERANVQLMSSPITSAYTGLLMMAKNTIDYTGKTKTAKTDGINIIYGADFLDTLNEAELNGLILHEVGHMMYQHLWLWKELWKENPKLANTACDFVVNADIVNLSNKDSNLVQLPPGGYYTPKYIGWDTLAVYRDLQQNGDNAPSFDDHDWEEAGEHSVEEIKDKIDQAIRQGAIAAGKTGGDVPRSMQELMEPKVDWRAQLDAYLKEICQGSDEATWSKPSRRHLALGMYLPSTYSVSIGSVLVGVDTSGSISMEDLTKFLSELVGICKHTTPESINLVYWDTKVTKHEIYAPGDYDSIIDKTKPVGGGGTNAACVANHIKQLKQTPQVAVMLTDGYNDSWGVWSCPVIWCIVGGNRVVPPVGSVIYV